MQALVVTAAGEVSKNLVLQNNFAKPTPGPNEVLVRVKAAGLNPVDWKMAKLGIIIKSFPAVIGCEIAGVVEQVGQDVAKLKVGDEVFGFTKMAPGWGAFAQYCLLAADLAFKKPAQLTFEGAATIGVGLLTASLGYFANLNIPFPSQQPKRSQPEYFLVWGGSGAVGACGVQLAAQCGYTVISTSSPHNAEYVKSLGASHVFDHSQPDVVEQIRKVVGNNLYYAFDTVGPKTANLCQQALSTSERAYLTTTAGAPTDAAPANVTVTRFMLAGIYENDAARAKIVQVLPDLQHLIDAGKIGPLQVHQLAGGLSGVAEGFEMMAANKVSGKKLVVTIA